MIERDRFKYVWYRGHSDELFDLQNDPHEMNNVYDDPGYSDIIRELKTRLLELKKQYGDMDEKYPELMAVREKSWSK